MTLKFTGIPEPIPTFITSYVAHPFSAETLPPGVGRALLQTTLTAVRTDRLPGGFLLGDPLLPLLAVLYLFRLHVFQYAPGSSALDRGVHDTLTIQKLNSIH